MNPSETNDPLEHIERAVQQHKAPRPTRRYRAVLFKIYLAAALAGFLILAVLANSTAYFAIDLSITRALQAMSTPVVDGLMRFVSWFGYAPQVVILCVVIGLLLARVNMRTGAWVSTGTGLGALLLNTLVKLAVHRPRPDQDLVQVFRQLDTFSFPSGHVMFYTAYFGFLAFLAYTVLKRSAARALSIALLTGLIGLVGPSRIYLGEHWGSDVLGGYLLGSLVLLAAIQVYQRIVRRGSEQTA